ncbi:MAG: hypothetical protein CSH36_14040, partial [Thalassolituus sp.]
MLKKALFITVWQTCREPLGKLPVERIYDLHGLRQQAAYEALEKFVLRSFQAKCRCLLVIT